MQKLTGINANLVSSTPKFNALTERIIAVTSDAILIGHNIAFDYHVLKMEFERLGIIFKRNTIHTLHLSKKFFPGETSYSLGRLRQSIGIPITNRHRALGDAQVSCDVCYKRMRKILFSYPLHNRCTICLEIKTKIWPVLLHVSPLSHVIFLYTHLFKTPFFNQKILSLVKK